MKQKYYRAVAQYYDRDAVDFEKRYWSNPVLQRLRWAFRNRVKQRPAVKILEVGIGPGFDLLHFAQVFPQSELFGLDVSPEMVALAQAKIAQQANAKVACGSVENISECFPEQQFDLIYVFFGALNTVEDLAQAGAHLRAVLAPGGRLVLSFVNRYYLMGMLIESLKGRFKAAFARLAPVWGGYSPHQFLASRCFRHAEIEAAFAPLARSYRRGYSIAFPAWYYRGWYQMLPRALREAFWRLDQAWGAGFYGKFGEYILYEFEDNSSKTASKIRSKSA